MDSLPTLLPLLDKARAFLAGKGIANARREAEWIFAETLALQRIDLYTGFDRPLTPAEVDRLRDRTARRGRREPLAYVLGRQPFREIDLAVGPGVLVPRPETEELVGHALGLPGPEARRVLDVGTGSGAIALAVRQERPAWTVTATDASAAALAIARANAGRLGLAVAFHQGDLATHLPGPFDLVLANLPYVAESERGLCDPETGFEPAEALFSPRDGLEHIARLAADLPRILAPGGFAVFEHGFAQAGAVRALAPTGFTAESRRDGAGRDRFTILGRPGA
ncbi:MAG: peptide chain release factor methyltransferase [Planctomycetota bacterium]|jgi:release factor glutamine methyltransferase